MPSLAPPLGLQATPQQACSVLLPAAGNEGAVGQSTESSGGKSTELAGFEHKAVGQSTELDRGCRAMG
eukprot:1157168-Pelagomonas_calceolata.AAC.3